MWIEKIWGKEEFWWVSRHQSFHRCLPEIEIVIDFQKPWLTAQVLLNLYHMLFKLKLYVTFAVSGFPLEYTQTLNAYRSVALAVGFSVNDVCYVNVGVYRINRNFHRPT